MIKTIVTVAISIIAVASVYFFLQDQNIPQPTQEVLGEPAVTIVRTNKGYEPHEFTIKKGDIVLWINESDNYHWPASDIHPTHGVYPEFDPLKPIAPGDDWKFKFDKVGEWNFHDHLRANIIGTITVTE